MLYLKGRDKGICVEIVNTTFLTFRILLTRFILTWNTKSLVFFFPSAQLSNELGTEWKPKWLGRWFHWQGARCASSIGAKSSAQNQARNDGTTVIPTPGKASQSAQPNEQAPGQ